MELDTLTVIVAALLLFSLFSGRLKGTMVTAPMVFAGLGFILGSGGLGMALIDVDHSSIHILAEFTLILVLFIDAARIDIRRLHRDHNLPVRMLLLGMPLAIVTGTLIAMQIFPTFLFWEAALLAALLAPTDAALGQTVVSATIVPVRIRQAINVESGLNDGLALPVVLLCATLASAESNVAMAAEWIRFGLLQLFLGPLVGVIAGFVGGKVLDRAAERGWVDTASLGIGILSLAVLAYALSELVGGNGFIAAFVAGVTFGNTIRHPCTFLFEFMETEGQLLMLITFLIFGAALLPEAVEHLSPKIFIYALMSLTVIRMVPIMFSLLGAGLKVPTQLFLGWFGPRGLASILFVLLILDESDLPHQSELLTLTIVTVALSIVLHGITAAPFSRAYGALVARMGECEEQQLVPELPLREGHRTQQLNKR